MTEAEFYAYRRMFAIINGHVHLAQPGDRRNHTFWLLDFCLFDMKVSFDTNMERIVRGYFLDSNLVAYKRTEGNDFSHFGVAPLIAPHLQVLADALGCLPETEVYFGARPHKEKIMVGYAPLGNLAKAVARLTKEKP